MGTPLENFLIGIMLVCMCTTVCILTVFFMFDMKAIDSWSVETRAACDNNTCQDYVITCHGGIPVEFRPIGNQVSNLRKVTTQEFCQH